MQQTGSGLWPVREEDRVGRLLPRRLPGGVFLEAVPGLAGQFRRQVPESHLDDGEDGRAVRCTCGERTVLSPGPFVECSGGCSRWFLPVGGEVRVAGPYPAEDS